MTPRQKEEIVYKLIDHVYSDTYKKITDELFDLNVVNSTDNKCSEYIMDVQSQLFRSLNNLLDNKRKMYNQHGLL
jgi:hypothetical protein